MGAYVITLDEYKSIETHCIALYVNADNVTYFDSFGVENVPKEIKKFTGNNNIITNIYKIQAYNSIMCGYFWIGFIDFILKGKIYLFIQICFLLMIMRRMIKYINIISITEKIKNYIALFAASIENLKNLKYHTY